MRDLYHEGMSMQTQIISNQVQDIEDLKSEIYQLNETLKELTSKYNRLKHHSMCAL